MQLKLGFVSFTLLIFLSCNVHAQDFISGRVTDEKGHGIESVQVIIINNTIIISECFTLSGGIWELNTTLPDSFDILFRYVGCRDTLIKWTLNKTPPVPVEINLRCINILQEIEIKDRKIGLVFKGDTIHYDLSVFTNGSEKNLGDILKVLPGISLGTSGEIEYNGKRIDKLLIEGKDILNNQHKLATEGIQATDILSIQIIEHYQTFSQKLFQGFNDQIALNVVLKEESKSKLKGMAQIDLGYKSKHQSNISLFKINQNSGNTTFLRSNNTGKSIISQNDFMSLQTNLLRSSKINNSGDIVNSEFNVSDDVFRNNDFLVARNSEISSDSGKMMVRYTILGGYLNRYSGRMDNQQFVNQNTTAIIDQNNRFKNLFGNFQLNLQNNMSNKIRHEFDIRADIKRPHLNSQADTRIQSENFKSNTQSVQTETNVNPEFYTNVKLSDKWHLTGQYKFLYVSLRDYRQIADSLYVIDLPVNILDQKLTNQRIVHNTGINLYYVSPKLDVGLQQNFNLFEGWYALKNTSEPYIIDKAESQLSEKIATLKSFINFKVNSISINPSISIPYYVFRNLGSVSSKRRLTNPSLSVKYSYGKVNFLLLQYNSGFVLPDHSFMNNLTIIQNSRNYILNQIQPEQISYTTSLALSHLYFNITNKSRSYFRIQSVRTSNPLVFQNRVQGNIIERTMLVAKKSESLSLVKNLSFSGSDFPLRFGANFMLTRVISTFYDNPSSELLNYNSNFEVQSKFNSPFQFEISSGLSGNQMKFGSFSGIDFKSLMFKAGIKYYKGDFLTNISFTTFYNYTENKVPVNFSNLSFNIQIPLKEKLILLIDGSNILNLNGFINVNASNNEFVNEIHTFTGFRGFLMIGAQYRI